MVRAADCVPVLLADDSGTVIGAAHCGRPGLVAGIVPATVGAMRSLGAGPLTAWVGPHVCGRCYEVPEQMRDDVAALERDSVEVVDLSTCTRESPDLFSSRRDGRESGRQAGIIRIAR